VPSPMSSPVLLDRDGGILRRRRWRDSASLALSSDGILCSWCPQAAVVLKKLGARRGGFQQGGGGGGDDDDDGGHIHRASEQQERHRNKETGRRAGCEVTVVRTA
jgi:hypothetical protein